MKWLPQCYLAVYSVWWHCGVNGGLQSVYWLHPHRGGPQHTSVCVLVREKCSCSLSPCESVESHRFCLSSCCPVGNHHIVWCYQFCAGLELLVNSSYAPRRSLIVLSLSLSLSLRSLTCCVAHWPRSVGARAKARAVHSYDCLWYVYRYRARYRTYGTVLVDRSTRTRTS